MNLYDRVFPPKVIVLPNGKNVTKPRSRAPLAAAVLLALTVLSVKVTGFDMSLLARRIKEFFVILGQMIPPQWSYMPQIWQPLFDTIVSTIPAPDCDGNAPLQILFSTIDYDDYVGRIGVGRIERGTARRNQIVTLCGGQENKTREVKLSRLYRFEGLKRVEIEEASAGELVAVAGVTGLSIGETACDPACIEPLPFVHIDEPTISMMFLVNDSSKSFRKIHWVHL